MTNLIVKEKKFVVETVEDKTVIKPVELKSFIVEVGIEGPQGPPGVSYVHDQNEPSNEWIILHYLERMPSVTIVDSSGRYVIGDVQYLDENVIRVTFSGGFSGRAYLN